MLNAHKPHLAPANPDTPSYGRMWAVVTPWLDHGRELYIRFVGSGEQCADYHAEQYESNDDYATVVQLPDNTIVYRVGHIIPREVVR